MDFDPDAPAAKLMTIHMAKGLEFDTVFIVGLEESFFPMSVPGKPKSRVISKKSVAYSTSAMTRARKHLSLTFAKNRTVFGNTDPSHESLCRRNS